MSQPVVIGGTYKWYMSAKKNSTTAPNVYATWDITGATITLSFVPPTGAGIHYTATIDVAADGTAYFTNPTTTFTVAGKWNYSWKISVGSIVLESQLTEFDVYASGAAA